MTTPYVRIVDNRPARRPGGARGASPPELREGAAVVVWLVDGQVLNLVASADVDGTFEVPWRLVDWWIPA